MAEQLRYRVEVVRCNSMGGITNSRRIVPAGVNNNNIMAHIANILQTTDTLVSFVVSEACGESTYDD